MANIGKFIDRSPRICAAGKSSGFPEESVASAMREYSLQDTLTMMKHDGNIWKEDVFVTPRDLPPIQNPSFSGTHTQTEKTSGLAEETVATTMREYFEEDTIRAIKYDGANIWKENVLVPPRDLLPIENPSFCGTNTQIKEVLNPPLKTRYQNMIEYLKDTANGGSWKKELGKSRDNAPDLSVALIPEHVTFGALPTKELTVKELIKTPYEVLWDGQIAQDWFKKTHKDYNPAERTNRGYNDSFSPNKIFGGKSPYDPKGIWVRCTCKWHINEPTDFASKIQADFVKRTHPQLGKVLAPNHNIDSVPEGYSFGVSTPSYGAPALLENANAPPCLFKRDFYRWLGSLNKFSMTMKKRDNDDFNFEDFYRRSLYFDEEKSGWLPIDLFYQICADHKIMFPKEDIESLMKVLGVIVDDRIDYHRFMSIINTSTPPLQIMEFTDIPEESKYYLTSNQAASCDYLVMDNSGMTAAGVPSIRFDLERPIKPFGGSQADVDHLGGYSSVNALITNYGLTYRDFFLPRSPEIIQTLFEEVGYNFPGDSFDKLWKTGLETDRTGLVCVNTFKNLLKNHSHPPKLIDEQEYEKKY